MGYGKYDLDEHVGVTNARVGQSKEQIFKQASCHPRLDPRGLKKRESRRTEQHPNAVGVVFALDVSGSMGDIPLQLATRTLPSFMASVLPVLPDPQIMLIAFGNATADSSPLQVGHFESEVARMDKWLAALHLEGGGGGLGESYDLAMYVAARHTAPECYLVDKQRGYFFMTGDEPPFAHTFTDHVKTLIGDTLDADVPIDRTALELEAMYHPFMIIPDPARAKNGNCEAIWRHLWDDRVIVLDTPDDTVLVCALLIGICERKLDGLPAIERYIEEHQGRTGAGRDRLVRAVRGFAEAYARGPLPPPRPFPTTPRYTAAQI
jgi:hypothetical protein